MIFPHEYCDENNSCTKCAVQFTSLFCFVVYTVAYYLRNDICIRKAGFDLLICLAINILRWGLLFRTQYGLQNVITIHIDNTTSLT